MTEFTPPTEVSPHEKAYLKLARLVNVTNPALARLMI